MTYEFLEDVRYLLIWRPVRDNGFQFKNKKLVCLVELCDPKEYYVDVGWCKYRLLGAL